MVCVEEIGSAAVHVGHHAGRDVAVRRQRRIVNLDRLPHIHQRRAVGTVIVNVDAADRADRSQHAVPGGLNHFVQERAELLHAAGDFPLHGIFDGLLARVRGVLHQLGDFHREPEKDRRDLRDIVRGARSAPRRCLPSGFRNSTG